VCQGYMSRLSGGGGNIMHDQAMPVCLKHIKHSNLLTK
jgi:hypothetical protein